MTIPAFTKTHFFMNKEFREVPGYQNICVSKDGIVARMNTDGEPYRLAGQYKFHNVKAHRRNEDTYYLVTGVSHKKGRRKTVGSHILICLAWNGPPPDDGIKYDVNHKDSNKINNDADNLEWTTRSQNITHCFDEGKNSAAVRVIAKNTKTSEETIFRSIKHFAEVHGLHRVNVRKFVFDHSSYPYNGFVYRIEDPRKFGIAAKKYQSKQVAFINYDTGRVTLTKSIEVASQVTGIRSSTIRNACNRYRTKGKKTPTKRYFFQYLEAKMKWPEFSTAELLKHEARFKNSTIPGRGSKK